MSDHDYPLVQYVASPDAGAEVLFDFNVDLAQFVGHDDLTWGAPEWQGEPGSVGGQDDYRTVQFDHFYEGSKPEAYLDMSALARVLQRPEGWLLVQMASTSEPRWFHVWRSSLPESSPEQVLLRNGQPSGRYRIGVALTADPYLVGERITLDTVTIANDPTAATNPMGALLPEILGDAPAPLRIKGPDGAVGNRFLLAVATGDDAATYGLDIGTGDAVTPGTDLSDPVADAAYAGGSYRQITFATEAGDALRLSVSSPLLPLGDYMVLVRVTPNAPGVGTWSLHLDPDGAPVTMDGRSTRWVPLGIRRAGATVPVDVEAGTSSLGVDLYAAQTPPNPSALLNVDAFLFIPTGSTEVLTDDVVRDAGTAFWWDGDDEMIWATSGASLLDRESSLTGVFPRVAPGETNRLTVLLSLLGEHNSIVVDSPATESDFDLSYRPRHLWPAP